MTWQAIECKNIEPRKIISKMAMIENALQAWLCVEVLNGE
jgi:hypothetical protein